MNVTTDELLLLLGAKEAEMYALRREQAAELHELHELLNQAQQALRAAVQQPGE